MGRDNDDSIRPTGFYRLKRLMVGEAALCDRQVFRGVHVGYNSSGQFSTVVVDYRRPYVPYFEIGHQREQEHDHYGHSDDDARNKGIAFHQLYLLFEQYLENTWIHDRNISFQN